MQDSAAISPGVAIAWVLLGILLSLVLPVAVRVLMAAKPSGLEERQGPNGKPTFLQRAAAVWQRYGGNRYLKILLAATLIAVVLVFLLGLEFSKTREAVLAGFAWESLINKLVGQRQA